MKTFIAVYAALRLTGPRRPSLTGQLAKGLFLVAISPLLAFALIVDLLVHAIAAARRNRNALRALSAEIDAAVAARQAGPPTFHQHAAQLRQMQGEE